MTGIIATHYHLDYRHQMLMMNDSHVRRQFVKILVSIQVHQLFSVNAQLLVWINRYQNRPNVRLKETNINIDELSTSGKFHTSITEQRVHVMRDIIYTTKAK